MALDDIIALRVDQGKFGICKLFLRKDPFLPKLCQRQHTQQYRVLKSAGLRIMKRDIIAESQGLFTVDRVRISAGNIDGFPNIMDPAHIVQKPYLSVRDGIIVGVIPPRSGRQAGKRVTVHDMCRGIRKHMGDPDKGDGVLDGHILTVDIACPHITDALFTLQIILGDMFHCDRGIFKVLRLPLGYDFVLIVGIKNHEGQHSDHNEHIDYNDPEFFHSAFRPLHFVSKRIGTLAAPCVACIEVHVQYGEKTTDDRCFVLRRARRSSV